MKIEIDIPLAPEEDVKEGLLLDTKFLQGIKEHINNSLWDYLDLEEIEIFVSVLVDHYIEGNPVNWREQVAGEK